MGGLVTDWDSLSLSLSLSQTANKCLAYMIEEVSQLFMVSSDMLQVCKFSYLEVGVPLPYTELGQDKYGFGDYRSYVEGCVAVMMKVGALLPVLWVCVWGGGTV